MDKYIVVVLSIFFVHFAYCWHGGDLSTVSPVALAMASVAVVTFLITKV